MVRPVVIIPNPDCLYIEISNELASELRLWSAPVSLMVEPTDNPLVLEMTLKKVVLVNRDPGDESEAA